MADTEYHRGEMDVSSQSATFNWIMKQSGLFAVPFCLALVVFFTSLVLDQGLLSLLYALITFVAARPVMRLVGAVV